MVTCAYCKKESRTHKGLSFHQFPSNQKEKDMWIKNMGRENWTPSKYSALCSNHFSANSIDFCYERARLRRGSIPTIFGNVENDSLSRDIDEFSIAGKIKKNINKDLASIPPIVPVEIRQKTEQGVKQFDNSYTVTSDNEDFEFHYDHTYDLSTARMKQKLQVLEVRNRELTKEVKNQRRKAERARKKITSLENVIKKLKKNMPNCTNISKDTFDDKEEINEEPKKSRINMRDVEYKDTMDDFAIKKEINDEFIIKEELDFQEHDTQENHMEINNSEEEHSYLPEKDITNKTDLQDMKYENTKDNFSVKEEIHEELIIKEELDFREHDIDYAEQELPYETSVHSIIEENRYEYVPEKDITNKKALQTTSGNEVIQKEIKRPRKSEATHLEEYRECVSSKKRQRSTAATETYWQEYHVRKKFLETDHNPQHSSTTSAKEIKTTTSTTPVERIKHGRSTSAVNSRVCRVQNGAVIDTTVQVEPVRAIQILTVPNQEKFISNSKFAEIQKSRDVYIREYHTRKKHHQDVSHNDVTAKKIQLAEKDEIEQHSDKIATEEESTTEFTEFLVRMHHNTPTAENLRCSVEKTNTVKEIEQIFLRTEPNEHVQEYEEEL